MFPITAHFKFYLYAQATDMRKSFDGLSGVVATVLGRDPTSGDVYVFVNRRHDRMKLLVWDRTGFWIFYKRLEHGTFQLPAPACRTTFPGMVLRRADDDCGGHRSGLVQKTSKLSQYVAGMKKIGADITEELEYQAGKLFVKRYVRPKYARVEGEGVVIGALPSRPIEKGLAGPGLLAHVLISKYVDHLPLYRQRRPFRRHEVDLAESTMCDWVKTSCALLNPLYEVRRNELLRESYLMADETPIRVLDSKQPCKRHDMEPFACLKDVLSRIADYPHRRVAGLLPQNWKPATSIGSGSAMPSAAARRLPKSSGVVN
ncbi:MAG: IS66 family insertion sequence element accessory protein TnpB [candidate division KSB1 bacterium]|nr:IS66 family insertion sequence element accessory protein TnpB [candidate division KSB1 bacterium]MDZ7369481.1 IS66 family insertion sequence element accessory protein TnpB [candidate division KSB1 bacterium]MDZ7407589.1 IS66 family insertion sequence element accessory protein TnpB [candidate division KSB1 bacterium]